MKDNTIFVRQFGLRPLEVADFNNVQKKRFIDNYFSAEPKTAKSCWQHLDSDTSLKELAGSPLLLTLLCIVYDSNNNFPANRAEIYADAVDVLLRKWDASRRIHRTTLYRNLSLQRKKDMLSQIAYHTFVKSQYFENKQVFENHIAQYIQNLPDAQANKIELDAVEILREIDAHHSLLTERAHNVYSFSHLTLQEYFTANYLKDRPNLLPQIAHYYTLAPRWREVFLLTVNLLPDATSFIKAIQEYIANLVQQNLHIASFLTSVDKILIPVNAPKYPLFIRRIVGITLALAIALTQERARAQEQAQVLHRDLNIILDRLLYKARALNIAQALNIAIAQARDSNRAIGLALDRAGVLIRVLDLDLHRSEVLGNLTLDQALSLEAVRKVLNIFLQ